MKYLTGDYTAYLLVGEGPVLDLIKGWETQYTQLLKRNWEIVTFFGASKYSQCQFESTVLGIYFDSEPPQGWKRPNKRGVSYPKKRSEAEAMLANQEKIVRFDDLLKNDFEIFEEYRVFKNSECCGAGVIRSLSWLPIELIWAGGQFAVVLPDAEAYAKDWYALPDDGTTLNIPAGYTLELPGCKRISKDEWEVIRLQAKIAKEKGSQ